MMNISNECQARRHISVFHWKSISKSTSFYLISKNSTKNLKLKIQPLGLGFLNLPAHAQNDALLLEPQGHIWYVFAVQNAILLYCVSGLKVTYKDLINTILYNSQNKHCMKHHCHECQWKNNLKNYLVEDNLGLEESDNEYSDTEINFSIWVGTDRANLITQSL